MKQEDHAIRKQEYKNAARYMVYLLKNTLNQIELRRLPANCTWETVWELVKRNRIEALIGSYLQKYTEVVPIEIRNEGRKNYNETLYRQIRFDVECEKIIKELENQKLAYLMLKGKNISKYYPQAGMRWMSDQDILCGYVQADRNGGYRRKGKTGPEIQYWEKRTCDAIQLAMEKCGFSLKEKGACHDSYIKQPMFKFEMHYQLFLESFDEIKAWYYKNPWKRAISDEKRPYRYYYSKEDEYIYFVTHAYKHFSRSGSGIRTLTDIYVYIKNNTSMDWKYISSQLKILELEDFEILLRNTAMHAFSEEGEMTTEEWDTVFYMIGSGIYGTSHNRVRHSLEKIGRDGKHGRNTVWNYMKERLWINEDLIKESFPFFYRYRFLRVFLPLYRIIRGISVHPKKIWIEWKVLFQAIKNNN